MTLAIDNPGRLLSPKETIEHLRTHHGINIALSSFYSMMSRGQGPKPTYFRGRPRFTVPNADAWVQRNLSDDRKNGSV
jgi:hypothetical protein